MLAKPLVIVAALLFSVSTQAATQDINQGTKGNSQQTQIQPVAVNHSSAETVKTLPPDAQDAYGHESVVFLAQGMGGFITL